VLRTGAVLATGLGIGFGASGAAAAAKPNFEGGFWGTKATTLPDPKNTDSLDRLFFVVHADQAAPVSEAAPGNPNYIGGRW
jgi:hypothetical protein